MLYAQQQGVDVYLLDTSSGRCTLPRGLGGQLLAGSLATSGLTGCLLGTGHVGERTERLRQM